MAVALTWDRRPDGREIGIAAGKPVAIITPNGQGRGGWVHFIAPETFVGRWVRFVRTRPDGRRMVEDAMAAEARAA